MCDTSGVATCVIHLILSHLSYLLLQHLSNLVVAATTIPLVATSIVPLVLQQLPYLLLQHLSYLLLQHLSNLVVAATSILPLMCNASCVVTCETPLVLQHLPYPLISVPSCNVCHTSTSYGFSRYWEMEYWDDYMFQHLHSLGPCFIAVDIFLHDHIAISQRVRTAYSI